ncbi:MAG: hypothetical protein WHT07_09880 [Desulfobaccales bacterium]
MRLLFAVRERLCDLAGDLWYRLDRRHREIVRRNLAFAYGEELSPKERERVAREVFRQFARFALELAELAVLPLPVIKKKVVIVGQEHFQAALAEGKGLIAIAAHAGNWEYTVVGQGLQYGSVAVVARELSQPWLRPLARRLRERCGNVMINKQGGLKDILSHLKQNRIVGIVIDQNTAPGEGLLVDFFGKPARTTPVAAILARRRGVPVLPVFSRRLPDGRHLLAFLPRLPLEKTDDVEADIRHHLQEQSRAVEAWVRAAPEQWLWLHRRWKNQFPELYEGL